MSFISALVLALAVVSCGNDIRVGLNNVAKAIERKAVRDGR